MKELLDNGNVVDDDGNVVPLTNVDQEAGAEWFIPEPYVPRSKSKLATFASEHALTDLQPTLEVRVGHEWQRDAMTWAKLGLDTFTANDYADKLSRQDYETWQRVIRNYANSLLAHANRIRNAEGSIEFDYELGKLYGNDMAPSELLEYAREIRDLYEKLIESGMIDQQFNKDMTKRKLQHAPHYEQVAVEASDTGKLVLIVSGNQKDVA